MLTVRPPPPPPSYSSPYRVSYGSLNPPPSYSSPYRVSYGSLNPPPSYSSPYRVSYGSLNPPPPLPHRAQRRARSRTRSPREAARADGAAPGARQALTGARVGVGPLCCLLSLSLRARVVQVLHSSGRMLHQNAARLPRLPPSAALGREGVSVQ